MKRLRFYIVLKFQKHEGKNSKSQTDIAQHPSWKKRSKKKSPTNCDWFVLDNKIRILNEINKW